MVTVLPALGMDRAKTIQVLDHEGLGGEVASKWPPLKSTAGEKGLSVVGYQRAATVRSLSSTELRRTRSSSSGESYGGWELEEENRRLRQELAKYQADSLERHRRPMAAIAGGGFRAAPRSCMCETLKVKLERCRAALLAAQRKSSFAFECRGEHESAEAACQTSCECLHAEVQSDVLLLVEAGCQASTSSTNSSAQTEALQADSSLLDSSSQTEAPQVLDAATQAVALSSHIGLQTFQQLLACGTQTEAKTAEPCATQTEVELQSSATQTEVPRAALSDSAAQTEAAEVPRAAVETQTLEVRQVAVDTQTSSASFRECGVQAMAFCKSSSVQVAAAKASAVVQAEPKVAHQAVQEERQEEVMAAKELETWQQMATSKAMSRLNVTILCPRAECTVNGCKVEMDSWNSRRLREDFEEKVLPRFMRIIMDEGEATSPTALVQGVMEELGSIFRERLAALLSAPNANAAMAAAKGRKVAE